MHSLLPVFDPRPVRHPFPARHFLYHYGLFTRFAVYSLWYHRPYFPSIFRAFFKALRPDFASTLTQSLQADDKTWIHAVPLTVYFQFLE